MFYGSSIIFAGIPSENYNLFLGGIDWGGSSNESAGSNVSLYTDRLYKKPKEYLYGTSYNDSLEFSMTLFCPDELMAPDFEAVSKWLFGKQSYQPLMVVEEDLQDVIFNCILLEPKVTRVGNLVRGVEFLVHADSPWAWTHQQSKIYTYTIPQTNTALNFYYDSDDTGYFYPTLEVTMNNFGGSFSITNSSDSNRLFSITGLSAGEKVTFANDLGILSSSTGLRRLSVFNKKWFRFVSGMNNLLLNGNAATLKFTYQKARKIGS